MEKQIIKLLERSLDYAALKQKVVAKNLANVGTLGYQAEDVSFDQFMKEGSPSSMKTTNELHFKTGGETASANAPIIRDGSAELKSGFNNVDSDEQMAEMAQNSMMFKFAARRLSTYYKNIQDAIKTSGSH